MLLHHQLTHTQRHTHTFGRINVTIPACYGTNTDSFGFVSEGLALNGLIDHLSDVQGQTCLDYVLFLGCMAMYAPCPGSAWCGANSRDELRSAVSSACSCNRANSCVVNVNGFNTTAENTFISIINISLPNYYVGSSFTGSVGDSNAVCQDVTGKRHNLHACSLHCVVHGGAGRVYIMIMWW